MRISKLNFLARILWLLVIIPVLADANESNSTSVLKDDQVVAVRTNDGHGIKENEIIQSKKGEVLQVVDRDNIRYELGSGSAAMFDKYSRFRLLRGSVIVDSKGWGTIKTANAQFEHSGKTIISYDYSEKSTSVFVVAGKARLRHETHTDRTQDLRNLEGATITSGDFYPTWLRSLPFNKVNAWLEKYEWPDSVRDSLLSVLREKTSLQRKVSSIHKRKDKHEELRMVRDEGATEELYEYFPTAEEGKARELYGEKFTSSELRGKEHNAVERAVLDQDHIEFLRPEEAASMIMPKMEIRPQITAFPEKDRDKSRGLAGLERVNRFDREKKKPKIVKVYIEKKGPYDSVEDPSVRSALERLDAVEKSESRTRKDELRDRFFDQLHENF